jgi:predicted transposase/invertase (TIGR01784 family)
MDPIFPVGHIGYRRLPANREYKDSVFSRYFSDPKRLIEVYNAINKTDYPQDTEVEIKTLENVLFNDQFNDVAFLMDQRLIVLIEHQSTINWNMPLRMLLYVSRVYERILDSTNIYKQGLIMIPKPEFIVLYNGTEPWKYKNKLKLSDAFIEAGIPNLLELKVMVYNINQGRNKRILARSKALNDYSIFVSKVREYLAAGKELATAIKSAISYCVEKNVMGEFLSENGSEVENMIMTEFNMEIAQKVWLQEGIDQGIERGIEKGIEKGIEQGREGDARNMLADGMDVKMISRYTGLSLARIEGV